MDSPLVPLPLLYCSSQSLWLLPLNFFFFFSLFGMYREREGNGKVVFMERDLTSVGAVGF